MNLTLVVLSLVTLGCARAMPSPPTTAGDEAPSPLPLDLAWRRPLDSQSAVRLLDHTIYESGWEGVVQYDLATGDESARFPGSDDTFRAWIGVDEAHDPVLIALGAFVLGRDRQQRLARFDAGVAAPHWIAPSCGRLYAAASHAGEATLYCAGPNDANGFGPGHLVRVDAATGSELGARATFVASGPFDTHAVLEVGEVIAVRAGDHVLGVDRAMRVRFDRTLPDSFGLATSGTDLWVVASGVGLLQLDLATGADARVISAPELVAAADPFTSRLGELVVSNETAFVESRGVLYAIDLGDGHPLFRTEARGAVVDDDSVYACSGSRFVELDRATGATRSSYSTGGCEVIGAEAGVVLVRYEAPTLVISGDARASAGVLAFARRRGAPPTCEEATISGRVTINGTPAPGITVRAGNAWATESSGVTHLWGGGTTPVSVPAIEAVTAADGSYRLVMCDRGHVPVLVDPEQAAVFAREPEADGILGYVYFHGVSEHVLDFDVRAHARSL